MRLIRVAVGLCALAALYSLVSPWLSQRHVDSAYDALVRHRFAAARDDAKAAHDLNPLAVQPLTVWALSESLLGHDRKALALYRQARDREPKNPETWYALGEFELDVLDRPRAAYRDLNVSWGLDRHGPAGIPGGALDRARCKIDPATCRR